ncbi:MAG: iron-sulfur cluster repair di-iron protein [Bdellovibrionales bacterium GWA2_49_15]|nr:MAG: iron-sulfur cluster repair di-iron protein [Bdellovibrionales bacterium GWA2_49_15]HAZ13036.1 iron-sulfur cluster repair di-iron protein [Bdellovibrionales bacterium]
MTWGNTTLGDLVLALPDSTALLRSLRLDFCCGGASTLAEACRLGGISLEKVEQELKKIQKPEVTKPVYNWPLEKITQFIVEHYHRDLRSRVPELILLAEKVERVHAGKPGCPQGVANAIRSIKIEMDSHMQKEEEILFPMIAAGNGSMAYMPIRILLAEHEGHGANLGLLRELAYNYKAPEHACNSWRALYVGLDQMEHELMEHIHLENHVLFTRALSEEAELRE